MTKIVLIGAGSTNFGLGTVGDIFKSKDLQGSTIMLHDIDSGRLNNTKNIAVSYKEKLGLNDMYTCHLNFFTNLIFPILEAKYSH